jgi:hypothetical protein
MEPTKLYYKLQLPPLKLKQKWVRKDKPKLQNHKKSLKISFKPFSSRCVVSQI